MNPEIPPELIHALADSADQTGCTSDLIVVSSVDLAAVLNAAMIEVAFDTPDAE